MISGISKKVISSLLFINLLQPTIFAASLKNNRSDISQITKSHILNTKSKYSSLLASMSEKPNELLIQSDTQSEINSVLYAEGNVSVSLGEKLLRADNLIYDKLEKKN